MKKERRRKYPNEYINEMFDLVLKLVKEGNSSQSSFAELGLGGNFANYFNDSQKALIRIEAIKKVKKVVSKRMPTILKNSPFKKTEYTPLTERNFIMDLPTFKYSILI